MTQNSPAWPVAEVDTLVLGAGVVGIATAYALVQRGHRVAIADRAEGPALVTSFANGGQLSYAYTDALGSPAMLKKLPFLALGNDPVFRVRYGVDPTLLAWGLEFIRNCSDTRFRRNTLGVLELALESRAAMGRLLEQHAIDFAHDVPGKMHLYYNAEGMAGRQADRRSERELGPAAGGGDAAAAEGTARGPAGAAGARER